MWPWTPWGKSRKDREEALRKEGCERLKLEQKFEAERQKEIDEFKAKQVKKEAKYFALPVYPSGRNCWACGNDSPFEGRKVELTEDGDRSRWHGQLQNDQYGGRRYLTITCERCGSSFAERFVKPTRRAIEIEPKNPVKESTPETDSKVKESEGE